jgi:hypothetical protein
VKFGMEVGDKHEHTYLFCRITVCSSAITDMTMMRNFEVIFEKSNYTESVLS